MSHMTSSKTCPHCGWVIGTGPELPHHLKPGTNLQTKYLIGKVLGQGGFGITYLAWDLNLDLKLAIKEFYPQGLASRVLGKSEVSAYSGAMKNQYAFGLDRFLSEAKTLARFSEYPNIVSVRDFFRANGTAYMVMNYVEGVTLGEYLRQKGGLISYEQALAVMLPIFDALKEVHRAGIMHRDISPDNIFIDTLGRVMLIDFGAARQELQQKSTHLSVIMKAGYSPEEQYRTRGEQGPWTDIYALAATIYRAITGIIPPESLDRLEEDILEPPSVLGIEIGAEQETILLKALAVRSRDRYRSIEEMQAAILQFEKKQDLKPETEDQTTIKKNLLPLRKKKALLLATVLMTISLLVLLAYGSQIREALNLTYPITSENLKVTSDTELNQTENDQPIVDLQALRTSDNISNNGVPELLFFDDFESGIITEWGVWLDDYASSDAGWKVITTGIGNHYEGRGHVFARPHAPCWTDYSVSFRFNLLEHGASEPPFNFSVRESLNPGHLRYFASIGPSGIQLVKQNTTSFNELSPSDFTTLKDYNSTIIINQWYELKVAVQGNRIELYLDDELAIEYEDSNDPYLFGNIAFETLNYSRVMIDDIAVTRDSIDGAEVNLSEEEQLYLPTLRATAKALRFYGGDEKEAIKNFKTYSSHFSQEEIKFVWWELYLACEPDRNRIFDLSVKCYDPNDVLIYEDKIEGFSIDTSWIESLHAAGIGYRVFGAWKPGPYKVKIYFENQLIAENEFIVAMNLDD